MDSDTWMICVIVILSLALAIVTIWIADQKILPIEFTEPTIPHFRVEGLQWTPFPTVVNIENPYDCNAESQRECDMNDATTLFGCRELFVKCKHFSQDTFYYSNGVEKTIKRNKSVTKGYALAITELAEHCNIYHGDFVLVAANDDSTEYMLVCHCRNPGYIGNDNILGACTSVRICNGRIKDINKPLKEIECICNVREISFRYDDGLSVCRPMSIQEANDLYPGGWDHLVPFKTDHLLDIDMFHREISSNINVKHLLNPCELALTDTRIVIAEARYNDRINSCYFKDFGLPLRLGLFPTEKQYGLEPLDAVLPTSQYRRIRIIDKMPDTANGKLRINLKVVLNFYDRKTPVYVTLPRDIGFDNNSQLFMTMRRSIIGGRCNGNWPWYNCNLEEYYERADYGIPMAGYRHCPWTFIWGYEDWEMYENAVSHGVRTNGNGVTLNVKMLTAKANWYFYGMQYCHSHEKYCRNGMLALESKEQAEQHSNQMIKE